MRDNLHYETMMFVQDMIPYWDRYSNDLLNITECVTLYKLQKNLPVRISLISTRIIAICSCWVWYYAPAVIILVLSKHQIYQHAETKTPTNDSFLNTVVK